MSYSFYCSKCRFDHAGECATGNPCAEILCPSVGEFHHQRHHAWVKRGGPQIDLWNTYQCAGCKRTTKRSLMQEVDRTPTQSWAGPCLPQS